MDASTGARAESGVGLETFRGLKAALDGLGVQEREAVRVRTQPGDTGLRFVQISTEQKRTIRAIVHAQQDLLAGRRVARHGLLRVQAS